MIIWMLIQKMDAKVIKNAVVPKRFLHKSLNYCVFSKKTYLNRSFLMILYHLSETHNEMI